MFHCSYVYSAPGSLALKAKSKQLNKTHLAMQCWVKFGDNVKQAASKCSIGLTVCLEDMRKKIMAHRV